MAFVLLLGLSGFGLLLYAAFWAVLPPAPVPAADPPKRDFGQLLPFVAIGLGVLLTQVLVFGSLGIAGTAGWLVAIIAVGAGIIWHQSDPERRRQWSETMPQVPWLGAVVDESDRRAFLLRFIGGGVLVAVGIIGVVAVYAPGGDFGAVLNGVIFALVGLAGVGVVAAPALWRTYNQLRAEREGRIREQERAEVAAMVHDQVLHTLALIQRNAADVKVGPAAGPRPGALAAQLALQADGVADRAVRGRAGAGGRRGRGHLRDHGGGGGRRRPGRRRAGRRAGRSPPARRWSTRPGTRRCRRSRCTPRRSRNSSACSSVTAERDSTHLQWRTRGTACEARSSDG